MNGTIRVMSEPGKGSVFEFTLPASFADTAGGSKPQLPMEDKRLKGLHVALVDTDLVHRVLSFTNRTLECHLLIMTGRSLDLVT